MNLQSHNSLLHNSQLKVQIRFRKARGGMERQGREDSTYKKEGECKIPGKQANRRKVAQMQGDKWIEDHLIMWSVLKKTL